MTVQVRVVLPDRQVRAALTGPDGLLARRLLDVGRQVVNQAKINSPVDTGRLRQSLQASLTVRRGEPVVRVGSDLEYAAAVHNGSRRTTRRGTVVITPGRPFLTTALRQVTGLPLQRPTP